MFQMISRVALLLVSLSASAVMASSLSFEYLQVRATPPGAANSAGYMVVKNTGHHPQSLVGVTSDIAKAVELHTHEMNDGVMSMHKVDEIEVPAGGEVVFKPASYHIMIMGLKAPLKVGEMAHFTFELKDGEKVMVHAPIVAPDEIKMADHGSHHDHMKMKDTSDHKHH